MSSNYLETLFGLSGQTAVVIGGAGVLGGAMCAGLVRAGAHVIVADLTEDGCKSRVQSLEQLGGRAGYCTVNVTSRDAIENLLAETLRQTGRADILVNAAGVNVGSAFLDATEADWDRILAVNLKAVFQSCQVFARHMVAVGGGAIVNIGSVNSHLPLSRVFAYAASKAGVLNLTRNIAHEFRRQGRSGQRDLPRFLSGRAEPQAAGPGTDRQHYASYADAAIRRAGRVDRSFAAPGFAKGRQFHHRRGGQRGWRFHGGVVLSIACVL